MRENNYFQEALADFTYEAASGGAVRHLADLGYTVKQIAGQLDFPTPYEKVQKAVWEHLIRTEVILLEEPGSGRQHIKTAYVREYDKYGKAAFRRVEEAGREAVVCWREQQISSNIPIMEITAMLSAKRKENGEEHSYISCDFGLIARDTPQVYQIMLQNLNERQREYIDGLPWEKRRVYHKIDSRMMEIAARLFGAGLYKGELFFLMTREKITLI